VVHPDDKRYQHLVGKKAMLPLPVDGREVSVEIATHPSVKSEFGSGILMVCSFGDQNDVAVFRELGLAPFQAIDLDGCMTSIAGPFAGMKVKEARDAAIEYLETNGKIDQMVEKEQEVPVSERGKNPVEIILLKEWYVRQTHIQDRISELAEEIEFHPPRNKQFLQDWMLMMEQKSSYHLLEPMSSHGVKTHLREAKYWIGKQGKSSVISMTSKMV
jgi:valyl-tRNA synthetase